MTVRLATWNVHQFIGSDGQYRPERALEVIRAFDCDVIALQEVPLSQDQQPPKVLVEGTSMRCVVGAHERRDGVWLGNVLLSRLPMSQSRRIDLAYATREPRSALEGVFETGGRPLRVVATHLGLRPAERRYQVRRIISSVSHDEESVTVLMGDFNEWFLVGRPLRWLHRRFGRSRTLRTFPARWPVLALDRVWVYPEANLITLESLTSKAIIEASDHLPVVASISLAPWGEGSG